MSELAHKVLLIEDSPSDEFLLREVIAGTGGARKARIARGGRGKSGGARVIYFVLTARGTLYLLDIYAKSAKEDLTDADKHEIRRLITILSAEAYTLLTQ